MNSITIKEVRTKQEINDFVKFVDYLYTDCRYYIPDLESDIRDALNPAKNTGLESSEVQAFIAYNEEGKPVGRIAGIINYCANKKWQTKNVRFGFIDFIDDMEISAALLKAVEQWGKERGMDHIQGPMGIFDFDKEGMLIEDFDKLGSMITIYNYPYYPIHMEALGYEKEVDWIQINIEIPKEVPPKYSRVANLSKEMFGLHVKKLTNTDILKHGYGKKLFDLLNMAYAPLFGYTELSDKQANIYIERYLRLIDKKLLPVVENEKGEVIGVAVTMGSLSHALRKTKGKLFPLGWYHLIRALKWKKDEKVELLLIAVHPDYQGLGVNALIFDDLIPIYNKYNFKYAETGPQLEDNIRELSQWKPLNPTLTKRRRCYKKKL
ncbi:MAG TPA: N-acetyltransferase [Dysgonomonas sp.]|uniref:N-acetyltransferase n=1 Tax=unclassified Dysgonomonas TaxID=2630389 RepID=UPI0025B87EFF|nr:MULTISPECIES: N-acetyltransferase [unclassified Dysgonomonas]HML65274.1 N-acetyltransferase [Dysgonomonas sp.]